MNIKVLIIVSIFTINAIYPFKYELGSVRPYFIVDALSDSDMDTLEKSLRLDGWQQIESNIFQKETSGEVLKLSVKPINMNEFMIVYYSNFYKWNPYY